MPYVTAKLRGKNRDIEYRVLGYGPGSGWETEWWLTDPDDVAEMGYKDTAPTAEEENIVNDALIKAEEGGAGGFDDDVPIFSPPPAKPIGTPISQLSGRPGHRGYEEFRRIAASYGYD
jgi:hypothetical protein